MEQQLSPSRLHVTRKIIRLQLKVVLLKIAFYEMIWLHENESNSTLLQKLDVTSQIN